MPPSLQHRPLLQSQPPFRIIRKVCTQHQTTLDTSFYQNSKGLPNLSLFTRGERSSSYLLPSLPQHYSNAPASHPFPQVIPQFSNLSASFAFPDGERVSWRSGVPSYYTSFSIALQAFPFFAIPACPFSHRLFSSAQSPSSSSNNDDHVIRGEASSNNIIIIIIIIINTRPNVVNN